MCAYFEQIRLGQLTQQNVDGQAPVLDAYDAMGNVCRQTVLLDAAAPEDATRNRILTRAVSAVQEADGVYQVITTARNNAAGVMLGSTQKTLISESVTLESKTVSVDKRGNTSTSWVEYGTEAACTQYSTIPGSALTAQTVFSRLWSRAGRVFRWYIPDYVQYIKLDCFRRR